MSERKGTCKTCGWYDAHGCGYGVVDRYRGIKEPCSCWKQKRRRERKVRRLENG